jgi:hypothetical protein
VCCPVCKRERQDALGEVGETLKGVPIRKLGPLQYSWGTEHIRAFEPGTLSALSAGTPVKVLHGGKTIGKTSNARVDGDFLRVDLELTEPSPFKELSLGYFLREDIRGVPGGEQVIETVTELAFVPAGRCGESCSIANARADALQPSKDHATVLLLGPRPLFEIV